MNAYATAETAYARSAAPLRTHSGAEYDAFVRVTRDLKTAGAAEPRDFPALARALHENRRLWTLLARHLDDDANALPSELRAQLFSLASFTLEHSDKVRRGDAASDVLVEINTAVMRGLRAQGAPA